MLYFGDVRRSKDTSLMDGAGRTIFPSGGSRSCCLRDTAAVDTTSDSSTSVS